MHKELELELKEASREMGVSLTCFNVLIDHAADYRQTIDLGISDYELFEIVREAIQSYDFDYEGKIKSEGDESSQIKTTEEMFDLAVAKLTGESYSLKLGNGEKFY